MRRMNYLPQLPGPAAHRGVGAALWLPGGWHPSTTPTPKFAARCDGTARLAQRLALLSYPMLLDIEQSTFQLISQKEDSTKQFLSGDLFFQVRVRYLSRDGVKALVVLKAEKQQKLKGNLGGLFN